MRVLDNDGQQRAARKALGAPTKPHRPPLRPYGGVGYEQPPHRVQRAQHPSPPPRVRPLPRGAFSGRYAAGGVYANRQAHKSHGGGLHLGGLLHGLAHGIEHHALEAAQGNPFGSKALEDISKGHVPHRSSISQDVEQTTGYREIRHIRQHPILGSVSALTILPWSRGLRAAAEGVKAAAAEESAARAAAQSYKAGKGVGGGLASAAKKLTPSERALRSSPARKELFERLDETLSPSHARAQKRFFDKSVKAMVRNGTAKNVHEAAGKLIRVGSQAEEGIHNHAKALLQHVEGRPPTPAEIRGRLHAHIDRNLPKAQAEAHKRLFDEAISKAEPGTEGRLAAIHAHLVDEAKAGGLTHPHDVLHQAGPFQDAKDWLADSVWTNMEPEDFQALPDLTVKKAIERYYHGGWDQFLIDSGHGPAAAHVEEAHRAAGVLPTAHPADLGGDFEADALRGLADIPTRPHPRMLEQRDFVEPPKSAGEVAIRAHQDSGTAIKGAFEHTSQGGIIHLGPRADVTTFPHELGHFIRRYGLNAEHESRLAEWAGVKNGEWTRAAEEKFARGLEKMIRQGDAPNNLVEEFKRLEPAFREAYPNASQLPTVPADVAQVYKEILGHRDGAQALYYTLHNAIVARRLAMEGKRGPNRSPEEAQQHALEADARAKEEGFGRVLPKVERLGENEMSVETGGKAGLELRRGMKDLPRLRNEQETIREVQRYRKADNLRAAQQEALSAEHPSEALTVAGGTRSGQLEHSQFEGFHGLRDYLDELALHLVQHPHLRPHEVQNAWEAILRGVEGEAPRKYEQKLLERAFGKEAESIVQQLKSGSFGEKIANIAGIPRSILASGDLSAPLRQGLVVAAAHPDVWFEGFGPMLRAARTEEGFKELAKGLHGTPGYAYAEKSGLSLTDIGEEISSHEEQFVSDMAEHLHELPIIRSIFGVRHAAKGVSAMVRMSDRAYVMFLNHVRLKLFNQLVQQAAENGWHLNDKLGQDIARYVNSATGRGDLGKYLKNHAPALNALFFSPRLLKSRIDFLNPFYYARMEPFARQQALRALVRLAGTMSTILLFARAAGATVVADPRNADFGKVRIGDTRLDIAGGFMQPIRLAAQLYTGQIVSSQTGRVENLSSSGFGRSRLDVVSQFLENKAAPTPSVIVDLLKGSQFGGQPITLKGEAYQHMVPLLIQDMADVVHNVGPAGSGYGALDLFGVGVNNYGAPGPKTKKDTNKLLDESQKAGLGKPPASVQNDVKWKAQLDANTYDGMDPFDRTKAAVKLYDERYGTHLETQILPHLQTEGQAEALYAEIRARLFPSLEKWQSAVNARLRAQKEREPVPQEKKSSAPAPPVVNTGQQAAYHIPTQGVDAAQHTITHGQHTSYIAQSAQRHGLDPQAVLAVASQEGLGGGVGDGGTSFGPFQLHEGGALPASVAARGAQYAQKWAWSPQGIDYALGRMASVAKGLKGQAAVSAIVRGFERPANPSGEIAGAMGAYGGSFSGGPGSFGTASEGLRAAPMAPQMASHAQAVEQILQGLASGNYNPIKIFTALSSQPLRNTVEIPGHGHIRFQIPKYSGPVGKAARGAIALAQAFLGTPYVYGGESPKGFDCSGLLQYIYAKQGIQIARTTYDQWKQGQSVPKSRLRPGDAVFFRGSDSRGGLPGHVGIYIGHGKFIEAPHTGATVRISNLAGYPGYVGARRYARARRKGRRV